MGSFEKLGILVIVVIIVMILAVAIYQWGGAREDAAGGEAVLGGAAPVLDVDYIDRRKRTLEAEEAEAEPPPAPDAATWPGGIPKRYTIQKGDMVWVLVVKRWRLREEFVQAITAANPRVNMMKLQAGKTTLVIPDPAPYRPGVTTESRPSASGKTVRYEVKVGDTLETIARDHLGAKKHWKQILSVNPGLNPRRLMPGQEILVPLK